MLTIEIMNGAEVVKTAQLDYSGTTRNAMWNSFMVYFDRHFGHTGLYWRTKP